MIEKFCAILIMSLYDLNDLEINVGHSDLHFTVK